MELKKIYFFYGCSASKNGVHEPLEAVRECPFSPTLRCF